MSFAGTAARGSAISSPVNGMYTHLEDSNPVPRLQFWNGSAWRSPLGMTLINTTSYSAVTSISINSVFSAEFTDYKIILSNTVSSVDGPAVQLRTRTGVTDFNGNVYRTGFAQFGVTNATGQSAAVNLTNDFLRIGFSSDVLGCGSDLTLFSPFLSQITAIKVISAGSLSLDGSTIINSTQSFDGFTLFTSSGNMTGTVRVYGIRS
jgi:hypothetical protein